MTRQQRRVKRRLEALLRRYGYRRDDRPDHREWMRCNSAFHVKIRLDQMHPEGWNGFQLLITAYTRWDITPKELDALVAFMEKEFSWS